MADLTSKQKAAVVLLAVDSQTAASVLKKLSDDELAVVTREMNNLGELQADDAATVLTEFSLHAGDDAGIQATPTALRERLELAVGRDGTREIFRDIGLDDDAAKVFEPLKELSNLSPLPSTPADAGSVGNCMLGYHYDADYVALEIVRPFKQEAPEAKNMAYIVNTHGKTAGVTLRYPLSVVVVEGI